VWAIAPGEPLGLASARASVPSRLAGARGEVHAATGPCGQLEDRRTSLAAVPVASSVSPAEWSPGPARPGTSSDRSRVEDGSW